MWIGLRWESGLENIISIMKHEPGAETWAWSLLNGLLADMDEQSLWGMKPYSLLLSSKTFKVGTPLDSIPGLGARSHKPQLRPCAAR